MRKNSIIPIVIVLSGALVAFAVYAHIVKNYTRSAPSVQSTTSIRAINAQDHIYGNPNAPVTVIEYSDFNCYSCGELQHTLERVMHDYGPTGQVAWIFRELPLTNRTPTTLKISQAAECVAKTSGNSTFWKFTNLLFANQPVDDTKLGQYITTAGGDPEAVASCVMSGSVNKHIKSSRANAIASGVTGVPTTFIIENGGAPVVIKGSYPYAYIKQAVATALIIASSSSER